MKPLFIKPLAIFLVLTGTIFSGCGGTSTGNPESEDVSVTGSAINAVGGAMSSSGSSGILASIKRPLPRTLLKNNFIEMLAGVRFIPEAFASVLCPSYRTAQGAGCTATGSDFWLSYNDCRYSGSLASWQGALEIELSSGTATCGSFPSLLPNGFLYRQFVSSAGVTTPSTATVTTPLGIVVHVDDASTNLSNFDGATISTILRGGYGSAIGFGPTGIRNSLVFGHREYISSVFDHSVTGSLTIAPTSLNTRTITGSVTVYHNIMKVIGTVQFSGLAHSDSCCWPTSGAVTTSFSAGSLAPTTTGAAAVGKQEIMTLTGCGTASLQSYDGTTKNVSFTRCF